MAAAVTAPKLDPADVARTALDGVGTARTRSSRTTSAARCRTAWPAASPGCTPSSREPRTHDVARTGRARPQVLPGSTVAEQSETPVTSGAVRRADPQVEALTPHGGPSPPCRAAWSPATCSRPPRTSSPARPAPSPRTSSGRWSPGHRCAPRSSRTAPVARAATASSSAGPEPSSPSPRACTSAPRSGTVREGAQTYPASGAAADLRADAGTPGGGSALRAAGRVRPRESAPGDADARRPTAGLRGRAGAQRLGPRPAWVARWTPLVQLCLLADALPPSAFVLLPEPVGLPTVELTVHLVRTPPAAGAWLRIRQRMTWLDDEVAVDDAVMHDEHGRLTAVVRQTRRTVRPRPQS